MADDVPMAEQYTYGDEPVVQLGACGELVMKLYAYACGERICLW